ncbi:MULTISPECIES: hypothetical protein [Pseudanabaena]|nr:MULTISPECIES: hypothetical protein [Pseudanabaena]MEA5490218.1 hypothetical protein [Pseudanabaena sp. CCNP1317]WGS72447.1 hypothetical protein OA858_00020 [Pseudanabaena galeata CCNP1313]
MFIGLPTNGLVEPRSHTLAFRNNLDTVGSNAVLAIRLQELTN